MTDSVNEAWTTGMVDAIGSRDPGAQSDAELVRAVARQDDRALEALVARHGSWAARFTERLTGSAATAEEVVQDAFLRLWQNAETWEGRARFSSWFYRVLHNRAMDHVRGARVVHEALDDAITDPRPSPERAAERQQRDARVRAALARLPERQRTALVLSHYEGLSQAEAAGVLGVSVGAFESLLSRARAALRAMLDDDRHGEEGE